MECRLWVSDDKASLLNAGYGYQMTKHPCSKKKRAGMILIENENYFITTLSFARARSRSI